MNKNSAPPEATVPVWAAVLSFDREPPRNEVIASAVYDICNFAEHPFQDVADVEAALAAWARRNWPGATAEDVDALWGRFMSYDGVQYEQVPAPVAQQLLEA